MNFELNHAAIPHPVTAVGEYLGGVLTEYSGGESEAAAVLFSGEGCVTVDGEYSGEGSSTA